MKKTKWSTLLHFDEKLLFLFGQVKTIPAAHLHAVYGQSGAGEQLFVANVTFEMLGLLMLNENLLVVKFTIAVPLMFIINQA